MSEFVCRVDADDRIVFINDDWARFADENGVGFLTFDKLNGVVLWDFISDLTTRHLYRVFVQDVRRTGRELSLPFRCDAPDRRRFMRMNIRRVPQNGVEFASEIIREEPREKLDLFDTSHPRRKDFIVMCSWCKKVKAPDWVEVEEGVKRLKLFDSERLPWVSHGICPECEAGMQSLIVDFHATPDAPTKSA